MTIGDRFSMYEYNTRSELVAANRYFGSDTNDTSNPVGLQDWFYNYDNIGNRTQAEKSGAYSGYTANALNQLVLHSQEPKGEGEVGYTQRTIPGSTDVTGSAETNVTVTVNNQAVNRQDKYWSKRLDLDNSESALYEGLNILGVYNPPGTNDPDIVTSVTGNVFLAETPEQFTYDDDGNMLSDGRFSYTWDGENRLIAVETLPDLPLDVPVVHVAFDYDYMSRRVGKHVYEWDDGTTNWVEIESRKNVFNGSALIREEVGDTQQVTTNFYIHGLDLSGGLSGAGGVGGLLAATLSTNTVFYTYCANGNVSELINSGGAISAHYEYSPFGETIVATGELAKENKFRFSTKPADDYTKLVLYQYRAYSPGMGRFISRDPIEEKGGMNLYLFALNNSLSNVDRLGLCSWPAMEIELIKSKKDISREGIRDDASGLAWLETWRVNVSLKSTGKWYRKEVTIDPSAKVQWWSVDHHNWPDKDPGYIAESELEHANIYKNWWDSLGSMVVPLTGEHCLSKAICNKALISCYSFAFQWGAEMENAALDCKGHLPSVDDADDLACLEEEYYRFKYAGWLVECELRKTICDKLSD